MRCHILCDRGTNGAMLCFGPYVGQWNWHEVRKLSYFVTRVGIVPEALTKQHDEGYPKHDAHEECPQVGFRVQALRPACVILTRVVIAVKVHLLRTRLAVM